MLENGTWMGALGEVQSGVVDTWAINAFVTLERHTNGFQFVTPFMIEKYGALMLRHDPLFTIDINSVTAGIDLLVYCK